MVSEKLTERMKDYLESIEWSESIHESINASRPMYNALQAVLAMEYKGNGVNALTNERFIGYNEALTEVKQAISKGLNSE